MDSCKAQPPSPAEADRGGVLAACVLLFLAHDDCDGGELAELVTAFGLTRHRPALPSILAALRRRELIAVHASPAGDAVPAVYRLTDGGRHWLDERAERLGETQRLVARFLHCYRRRAGDGR